MPFAIVYLRWLNGTLLLYVVTMQQQWLVWEKKSAENTKIFPPRSHINRGFCVIELMPYASLYLRCLNVHSILYVDKLFARIILGLWKRNSNTSETFAPIICPSNSKYRLPLHVMWGQISPLKLPSNPPTCHYWTHPRPTHIFLPSLPCRTSSLSQMFLIDKKTYQKWTAVMAIFYGK